MGSCVSKQPDDQGPPPTGRTQQAAAPATRPAARPATTAARPTSVGNRLGSEAATASPDSKAAAARAAELRYAQQQQKLKSSELKLRDMSKKSRAEKGL